MNSTTLNGEFCGELKDVYDLLLNCASGNSFISLLTKDSVILIHIIQNQNSIIKIRLKK